MIIVESVSTFGIQLVINLFYLIDFKLIRVFFEGQEKFHALGPIYYRSSNGALLVYDITDEQSFQKIKIWIKELKKVLGNDISIIIVGNKIDMAKDRVVPLGE